MASPAKPYELTWERKAKDLEEINRRLSLQLYNANKMLAELYTIVKNHEERLGALE